MAAGEALGWGGTARLRTVGMSGGASERRRRAASRANSARVCRHRKNVCSSQGWSFPGDCDSDALLRSNKERRGAATWIEPEAHP